MLSLHCQVHKCQEYNDGTQMVLSAEEAQDGARQALPIPRIWQLKQQRQEEETPIVLHVE